MLGLVSNEKPEPFEDSGFKGKRQGGLLLVVDASKLLEAEAIEGDEAGGVVLVVSSFLSAFHGGDMFVVKAVRGAAAGVDDVAFIEFEANLAVDRFLGLGDEGLEGIALGCKPEAVVNKFGVGWDESIAKVLGIAVDGEGLEVLVGCEEDGAAGSLIDAAGLHADEAVLDDVNAADAVLAAEEVEDAHDAVGREEGVAIALALDFEVSELGDDGGEVFVLQADDVTFLEETLEVFRGIGGILGSDGKDIHVFVGLGGAVIPGVLEGACFEGDVEKVAVHGVRLLVGSLDLDAVLFTVGDHFGAAGEFGTERIITPRGDHFNVRGEGVESEFKANLVVAFTSGSVSDGVGTFGDGDIEHSLDDAGAGDGGSEEIAAFIDGIGLKHGENVIGGELFPEVADVAFGRAGREGFGFEAVEFLTLADVGTVSDNFSVILFLEPEKEDRGVETSGICDNNFHRQGG